MGQKIQKRMSQPKACEIKWINFMNFIGYFPFFVSDLFFFLVKLILVFDFVIFFGLNIFWKSLARCALFSTVLFTALHLYGTYRKDIVYGALVCTPFWDLPTTKTWFELISPLWANNLHTFGVYARQKATEKTLSNFSYFCNKSIWKGKIILVVFLF